MGNMQSKKISGFTIVELIVVVAIIAVLATILVPYLTDYRNQANNASIKADMEVANKNLVEWDAAGNRYDSFASNGGSLYTTPSVAIKKITPDGFFNIISSSDQAVDNFCICSNLNTDSKTPAGSSFCVDSTGYKKQTTHNCDTRCWIFGGPSGQCTD
jgi:prepilin-type N-terminal cleavage/methylation domain-containing protein